MPIHPKRCSAGSGGAGAQEADGEQWRIPQAHGGALLSGGKPGNAGGRRFAERQAQRRERTDAGGVLVNVDDRRMWGLRAAVSFLKYGRETRDVPLSHPLLGDFQLP